MKLITVRSQIRELPERMKELWKHGDRWNRILQPEPDTEKIHAAVSALDLETATVEDVYAAMQFRGGWVGVPTCNECRREVDAVVQLGEEPDIESSTAHVCFECLRKALEMKEPS